MPELKSIHDSVFVHPSAQIYGKVEIAEDCSIWPNVVMRAENDFIQIGRMTNIQDFVMIHVGTDVPTVVGEFCSITHRVTLHGCTIGDHCLIGIGAVIMDGAEVGSGSIVAGGAFIPEGKVYPPNSIIMGAPAKVVADRETAKANRLNAWMYYRNAQAYKQGDHRAWTGSEQDEFMEIMKAKIENDTDL